MPSFIFNCLFYIFTFLFAIFCVVLSFFPGRKPIMWGLKHYTKFIVTLMEEILEIDIQVSGQENVPTDGPAIIASKHQSYGDGFLMFSQFNDLTFVAGDAIEKFWLIKRILAKMGAVVLDNCGGAQSRERLSKNAKRVRKEGRLILIYPEGHLSKIGTQHRYRKGVFHMYQEFGCPVIPAATNLGQRWNQEDKIKYPGRASLEFLKPIPPGLEKGEFMERLETAIETRSKELLDLENLGALNPNDIGKTEENDVAKAKRESREANESETGAVS